MSVPVAVLAAATSALPAGAAESAGLLTPRQLILRHGIAPDARATTLGVQWDLPWRRSWGRGILSAHAEISLGHWRAGPAAEAVSAVSTQVGVTPVFRYSFRGNDGPFVEAGIGANVIAPLYRSRRKRFSTAFNFGDHVGIGWRAGAASAWEFGLRFQHFSNAGIRHPNPGENFVQVQVAYDLK